MLANRLNPAPSTNGKPREADPVSAQTQAAPHTSGVRLDARHEPSANGDIGGQPAAAPAPGAQHDASGRFAKGNRGGPGNPHARQVAELKKAFLKVVTPDEFEKLVRFALELAYNGNVQAMKLIFSYTLGKPAPAANPDDVDADELRRFEEGATFIARGQPIRRFPEPEWMLKMLRVGRENATVDVCGAVAGVTAMSRKERRKLGKQLDKLTPAQLKAQLDAAALKGCYELGIAPPPSGTAEHVRVVTPPSANGGKR